MLGTDDFTLVRQWDRASALGGYVTQSGLDKLARHADVVDVWLVGQVSISLGQSVPLIKADLIHTSGWDGSGINVAVLDTGIDTSHVDLSDSIIGEECFQSCPNGTDRQSGSGSAEDDNGHGTRMSGIITSNGVSPGLAKGVAPGAGIFAYRVTDSQGEADDIAILDALKDIEDKGYVVDFVNMSLNSEDTFPGDCSTTRSSILTQIAIIRFFGDVLTFAGTGNNANKTEISWPACAVNVVAVGSVYDANIGFKSHGPPANCSDSVTAPDKTTCFSNSSPKLDLLAPGCEIETTALGGGVTSPGCGTSRSVPVAVGVAALMLDVDTTLTPFQIEQRMVASGTWVKDDLANRWTPRVDARAAVLGSNSNDYDGDGCKNGAEYGTDEIQGGRRNPLDPWDFYDVLGPGASLPKDGVIDLPNDILGVIQHFSPAGAPPYDVNFDRGPLLLVVDSFGFNSWSATAPDGVIDLPNDVLGVILQFGHNCS